MFVSQKQLYAYSIRFFDVGSIGFPLSVFASAMYALTVSGWNRSAFLLIVFRWLFTCFIVIAFFALFFRSMSVLIIASSFFIGEAGIVVLNACIVNRNTCI